MRSNSNTSGGTSRIFERISPNFIFKTILKYLGKLKMSNKKKKRKKGVFISSIKQRFSGDGHTRLNLLISILIKDTIKWGIGSTTMMIKILKLRNIIKNVREKTVLELS